MSTYTDDYADDAAMPHVCPECSQRVDEESIRHCKTPHCTKQACHECRWDHNGFCARCYCEDTEEIADDLPDEAYDPQDWLQGHAR